MGNASPFQHHHASAVCDPESSPILSEVVKECARSLQSSRILREKFVAYLFSKRWMRDVINHRSMSFFPQIVEDGQRTRLFYHMPNGGKFFVPSISSREGAAGACHSPHEKPINKPLTSSRTEKELLEDQDTEDNTGAVDTTLFTPESAAVLVAVCLVPFFAKTTDYRLHLDDEHSSPPNSMHRVRSMMATAQALTSTIAEKSLHLAQRRDDEIDIDDLLSEKSEQTKKTATKPATDAKSDEEGTKDDSALALESFLSDVVDRASDRAISEKLEDGSLLFHCLQYLNNLRYAMTVSFAPASGEGAAHSIHHALNASSHAAQPHLPLIRFVNGSFETMTQWSRIEVLGKSNRFLYSEEVTEMHQLERIQEALREEEAIKLAVTNVRRDGSSFFNLAAVKPVVVQLSAHHAGPFSRRSNSPNRQKQATQTAVLAIHYDVETHAHSLSLRGAGSVSSQKASRALSLRDDLQAIDLLLQLVPLLFV